MSTTGVRGRWTREWLAVAAGSGLLVLGIVLLAIGGGFRVIPEDIAGPPRPNAALWQLLSLTTFAAMPPAVSWISGRRGGPLVGLVALVGGITGPVLAYNAVPIVFDSLTMLSTLGIGFAGGAALRHRQPIELAARAVAVVVLVAGSWLLSRAGILDPLPLLVLPALAVADWLATRVAGDLR